MPKPKKYAEMFEKVRANTEQDQAEGAPEAIQAEPRTEHKATSPARVTWKAWTRGEGKSSNPEYVRLCVFVPRTVRTEAERKWEDTTGSKDSSDLIGYLLERYINTSVS